jgi:enoyl-CoA hydratase
LSLVRLERGPRSATLVIDNPDRGNALTPAMMQRASDLLRGLSDELVDPVTPYGALVLRGAGDRVFCAGYDLSSLAAETATRSDLVIPELLSLLEALSTFPVPTIAALHGHAIGGGALLASLCDLRYCKAGVRFRIPTTRIGILYPLAGLRRLVALLGPGRALEVLLLADDIDAETGSAWGLYQGVAATARELDELVESVVGSLAARAPLASRGTLGLVRALADSADTAAVEALHAGWLARCVASDDLSEGLDAAQERRVPIFGGS